MKLNSGLLALSLIANAALAGGIVWGVKHPAQVPALLGWVSGRRQPAMTKASPDARAAAATAKPNLWQGLSAGADLHTLIGRLRAAGFSDKMVRAIIGEQVHEQFADRRKEYIAQFAEVPYWKRKGWGYDAKLWSGYRSIQQEESNQIRALLGNDDNSNEIYGVYQKERFGDLDPDKMQHVQEIESDYNDLTQNIYSAASGAWLPSDRKQLAFLHQQQAEDLAKVLTPDELLAYQMRSSDTAGQVRNKLAGFNPSEDEFKAIFQAQYGVDSQSAGANTPDELKARAAAQTQADAAIQAALGPDRYAQYQEDTNPTYLSAYNLAQRLNLPSTTADQVYQTQQAIKTQAAAIIADNSLTQAEATAQLQALSATAKSQVTTILGADGMAAYQGVTGANWMSVPQLRALGRTKK